MSDAARTLRGLSKLIFLCLLGLLQAPLVRAEGATLSIGIVPQFPMGEIASDWTPVLRELSKAAGLTLKLSFYTTIPDFEAAFLKGAVDVAYLNPYHAVMAKKAAGYEPIIRDGRHKLKGILVVRKDSPLTRLEQLNEAVIGFPAPNAFGASLYMRAILTEQAGLRFTPKYLNTHTNVYLHVSGGRLPAGGGIRQTLESEPPEIRESLRVLYETPETHPHPVVVHPRVPAELRRALQDAFVALGARADATPLLQRILMPSPVKTSYADYASLDKLHLERYVVLKKD